MPYPWPRTAKIDSANQNTFVFKTAANTVALSSQTTLSPRVATIAKYISLVLDVVVYTIFLVLATSNDGFSVYAALSIGLLHAMVLSACGMYRLGVTAPLPKLVPPLLTGAVVVLFPFVLLQIFGYLNHSLLQIFLFAGIVAATLLTCRILVFALVKSIFPKNAVQQQMLLIGDNHDLSNFLQKLSPTRPLPFHIAGYYTIHNEQRTDLAGLSRLGSLAEEEFVRVDAAITRVLLVARQADSKILNMVMRKISALSAQVDLCLLPLLDVSEQREKNKPFVESLRLVTLKAAVLHDRGYWLKRCFDVVASAGLILLLSPVLAACAVMVRRSSPGAVLFRQPRWGEDGKIFHILKFRSMYADVCDNGTGTVVQARRGDNRITPVGAFLRKTSLDELPQLFNIFKGDMSLIGPRPHAVAHNEQYARILPAYLARHQIKPGLTGLAQVNGYRGETPSLELMSKRVDYDNEYIRTWSVWLDFKILFRTVGLVLARTNAH